MTTRIEYRPLDELTDTIERYQGCPFANDTDKIMLQMLLGLARHLQALRVD